MSAGNIDKIKNGRVRIAVIGLGYVGLPLAVEFGKRYETIGFDVKQKRLEELSRGKDSTLEISADELAAAGKLTFTDVPAQLKNCDIFIVTVPTPVDAHNHPDLTPLRRASETVGKVMAKGAIIVYESTVYPGCTEEVCVPILEEESGLVFNKDFFCGYSPERINPGDKLHTLRKIVKITSGSTPESAETIDALYNSILDAGTHMASSIKVAEAAKVIENSQRDLNIAFVNELAKICHLIGIDTNEVLAAAGTKWNFLDFKPGLVGGHCIGVDPYYLTYKAQALGYLPEVILAGRRINDGMGRYVATEVAKLMVKKERKIAGARVLVLGITFKENTPDIRNSHVCCMVRGLQEFGCDVDIFDPWADPEEVRSIYALSSFDSADALQMGHYDALVFAVPHRQFMEMDFTPYKKDGAVVFDVKGMLDKENIDGRL